MKYRMNLYMNDVRLITKSQGQFKE